MLSSNSIRKILQSVIIDYISFEYIYLPRFFQEMAVDMEKGIASNPLHLEWVNGPPVKSSSSVTSSLTKPSDFESITLTKLRQAEERRRLIEELKNEDATL